MLSLQLIKLVQISSIPEVSIHCKKYFCLWRESFSWHKYLKAFSLTLSFTNLLNECFEMCLMSSKFCSIPNSARSFLTCETQSPLTGFSFCALKNFLSKVSSFSFKMYQRKLILLDCSMNLIGIFPVSKYNNTFGVLLCALKTFLMRSSSTDSSFIISPLVKLYQLSEPV